MKIEYHPAIEAELKEIINHNNKCSNGLGKDFLNEFERHVLGIASNPYQWETVDNDIRRSLLRRFPFVIYFRIVNSELLPITIIKHQRRHPKRGLTRR